MPNRTYYLNLTPANIKNGSIYLSECMDIFPVETIGGANNAEAAPRMVEIQYDSKIVRTDIDRAKRIFRKRGWVRQFFKEHRVRAGHRVVLEQIEPYSYHVSREPCIRIKCLSIQQPWADLILRGEKLVENRSWFSKRAIQRLDTGQGVSLGIHVSSGRSVWKRLSPKQHEYLAPGWKETDDANAGHVVAVVDVLQICPPERLSEQFREHKFTDQDSKWCWVLGNPRKLSAPFPVKANVRPFDVDIPCRLLPADCQATPW